MKLFMVLLGSKPAGRHTEQHDIFFGIANEIKELIPEFKAFWPEAATSMHVDGWREVTQVDGFQVQILPKQAQNNAQLHQLYFINLGGYKKNEFEEFHYKMLVASSNKADAIHKAKETAFFKHTHFDAAKAHIDDKYGIDIDDVYEIEDVLTNNAKEKFTILLTPATFSVEDELHLGYFKLSSL